MLDILDEALKCQQNINILAQLMEHCWLETEPMDGHIMAGVGNMITNETEALKNCLESLEQLK